MTNHTNFFDQQDLNEFLQHSQNQEVLVAYLELLDE